MDIGWLVAVPAFGAGYFCGWVTKPVPKPHHEVHARISDLEKHTHHHAPAPVVAHPEPKAPHHGHDYVAWGHDGKKHWRRHKDGTVHHSEDGKF